MFSDPLFWLASLAVLVTSCVLMVGIGSFARGGAFHAKHSNRMMRYRLLAQFIALILLIAYAWARASQ